MTVWVVCGACRGVGKTRLSRGLAAILPHSVCAKIGHNPAKSGRPENYFTSVKAFSAFQKRLSRACRHCIVESNFLALSDWGAVRIFIGAPEGSQAVRRDAEALRSGAHLRIVPRARASAWRRVLEEKLDEPALVAAVCSLLEAQRRFISERSKTLREKTCP